MNNSERVAIPTQGQTEDIIARTDPAFKRVTGDLAKALGLRRRRRPAKEEPGQAEPSSCDN